MQNYKDLKVWLKAHEFTLQIYTITKNFPKDEIYTLTSQLRRAAMSVPANIAEGCGKNTQKELANYLNISLGSSNECEYYLLLARDLSYLSLENFTILENSINMIKAMLIKLLNKVRSLP